jgi:hypothetical protein
MSTCNNSPPHIYVAVVQQSQLTGEGGNCYTSTRLLTAGVALPTEIGADGQRLFATKGDPTSSRG